MGLDRIRRDVAAVREQLPPVEERVRMTDGERVTAFLNIIDRVMQHGYPPLPGIDSAAMRQELAEHPERAPELFTRLAAAYREMEATS